MPAHCGDFGRADQGRTAPALTHCGQHEALPSFVIMVKWKLFFADLTLFK
jgi:hypothetical protein